MKNFLKNNWLIILILLAGAFFRLYNISGYMTFLGDEGRDSIIVRNLLVHFDPILIGPGTSVGGMYLGPLYYYFMAPFLLISNFSPIGPAVGVALLGVATIYLVFIVAKEWFGKTAGLVSALLYSISPTVITYSHSSWNPNIMPFFSLLSVYSIWKVWKYKKYNWLLVTAISFAFVLQSHYLGVLIAPVLIVFWFLSKVPKKTTLISASVFIFLMSPLLIFDVRHDWMNTRALYKFVTVKDANVSVKPVSVISKVYPVFEQVTESVLTAKNIEFGRLMTLILTVYLVFTFTKKKNIWNSGNSVLALWLLSGLIGFGLYRLPIYDHYYGFLFVVPFLIYGSFVGDRLKTDKNILKVVVFLITFLLVLVNLANNPLKNMPNNQMQRSKEVALKVLEIADGKPFNLAVLAERNYEDGYRYFMDVAGATVLHADRWDKNTISDTLVVVCEEEESKCDPTHSPKAEVANFGWSKIENKWQVDGVIIYKLVHSR
jgi:4-amino-4-deoxy-L-arabinose transferase-like glycosyltransferase